MYAEYIREREGKLVLESEKGFAVYGFNCIPGVDFPHAYIQDIWVKPDFRKFGEARALADSITKEAKAKGFKFLFGSVDCNAKNAHASLLVLIAYGMRLYTASGSGIYFVKEI